MNSFGNSLVKGASWMLLLKLCERGLGIISTIILARILVPEDFGLVAMTTNKPRANPASNASTTSVVLMFQSEPP